MSLEYRNGRPSLRRSVRIGTRVTSEYICSGPAAEFLDFAAAVARAGSCSMAAQEKIVLAELAELERRALERAVARLTAAGYHRDARGKWRKKRRAT
jgi:hypothetical protein